MNAVSVHPRSSFAEICGHSRPFAFQKEFNADGRRSPRINVDQSQVSAPIGGHPRSSAISNSFNANGRKWPQISANHGFNRIEEMEMNTQDTVNIPDSFASICGHPRSSAFSNSFNANERKYPRISANHGFNRIEEMGMNTQDTVNIPDSFASIRGHSRPFAFQKGIHADGRRSPRINADQSDVSAKICGHPRSSAFSNSFNANERKYPRISANHGFNRIEEMGMNTQDTVNIPDSFASICGHSRPFAFEKEFHADGRRSPRINADQSDVSAEICGHPRSSAFSNSFNANSREYPQISANQDQ